MKKSIHYVFAFLFFFAVGITNNMLLAQSNIQAPIAKKIPKEIITHGDSRIDNYFWMRLSDKQKNAETPDKQTQDVLDYLHQENEYTAKTMEHTNALQEKLYTEMVSRIKKDDASVPVLDNGYSYYTRFEEDGDYALYCRKKVEENATEEIILNGPEMAKGFAYYGIGSRAVSTNNELVAFGIDTISRRQYTIYFKDLNTGKLLDDKLSNTSGNATWANDNKTVFYATKDPETLRQDKIYKHILGTDQAEDILVYEEKDDTYRCAVWKSKSKAYLFIGSFQTLSTEMQYLDANTPNGNWKLVQSRESDLEYQVDHFEDHFYIRTNLDAKNFRLVKTPITKTTKENWVDVIPHRKDVYFQSFDLFKNHLVVKERKAGLINIRVKKWKGAEYYIPFNDPAYLAYTTANIDFDTNKLRYKYSSLTTPDTDYEYNMDTKTSKILKQEEVLDPNFSITNYVSERHFATAKDGTQIPISIVYKKGFIKNGNNPLLLYAYGSYGNSIDPGFNATRLSLLDRGFVYAIAHVRGGQEMGRDWYENGKLLKKKNTFTDFIDCGEHLIKEGFTSSNHLYALGGSAGGLLMGAIVNMKPELWNGVVAAVPFVDIVSTMLDESIPLTTFEFDEWGNPKIKAYYDYMKSYSPYDNVETKNYPNILITTGYWDSQVQYWEPAKWIAKLRDLKTDDNLLLLDCNMDNGHGGASGRFERYKQSALMYSFFLNLEGITE
ncbi:S9 family peptidase [Lacinutrix sp. C3R15]|uniref:S9 family peptidase n=1 Tax=Flavobacteriaceae TaxID=49546 RepID=UPI001C08A861|nr:MULTISPECIES: S9 family peptidase [Flavobacteriaceae]MBU2940221.1 S9 family peptidase [Lacinutrix sp. C3R15]MDO6623538.1 S9 family peptidase [Oceanihabitans sp. 1_MG-2023]